MRILGFLLTVIAVGLGVSAPRQVIAQQNGELAVPLSLSLDDCIGIALSNQPAIAAKQAAVGIAVEQARVARSYYHPQLGFNLRYTAIDEPRSVTIDGVFTPQVTDVFSDAAAFFQIARTAGSTTANFAIDNPNTPLFPGGPTFNSAKQAAAAALPDSIQVDLLGTNFLTTELLLVQPLWTGGKIRFRELQAELGIQASRLDVERVRQITAYNVTRAYHSVNLARTLENVAAEAGGEIEAVELLIQSYLEDGRFVTAADLYRVRSVRLTADGERRGIAQMQTQATIALNQAIGVNQVASFATETLPDPSADLPFDLDVLHATAIQYRPELAQASVGVRNSMLERRLANAQFHPDIVAFGRYGTIFDDQDFANPNDSEEWAGGVVVSVPVYTGLRRGAQQRQADFLQQQMRQVEELLRQQVEAEVGRAYYRYREMAERIAHTREALRFAKHSNERLLAEYQAGTIESHQWREYFKDRLMTRLLLTAAEVRYHTELYELRMAIALLKLATATNELPVSISDRDLSAHRHLGDTATR